MGGFLEPSSTRDASSCHGHVGPQLALIQVNAQLHFYRRQQLHPAQGVQVQVASQGRGVLHLPGSPLAHLGDYVNQAPPRAAGTARRSLLRRSLGAVSCP